MKFNHLNVPDRWKHYWTRYPEGYTIIEALISWVSQVDDMVDNQNKLNDNVAQFRNEIDAFVGRFDDRLQDEVTTTLQDWQSSGFLDVVISEALQWQLNDYIATNEADKVSITAQLQQTEQNLNAQLAQRVNYLTPELYGAKGDGVTDDTTTLQNAINDAAMRGIELRLSNKTYLTTAPLVLKDYLMVVGNSVNDEYSKGAIIKNITSSMFTFPFDNAKGTYRNNGIKITGICFIGASNTRLFDNQNQNFLYWSQITNCGFRNFLSLFDGLKITGCWFKNIYYNKGLAVGKVGGSDNLFADWFVSVDEENVNRQLMMFDFDNMMLSKFENMFLTGSLQVGKGIKNIFRLKSSTSNQFNRIYFDYCDEQGLIVEVNSSNNVFTSCAFRGNGRRKDIAVDWIVVKTGSNNNVFENNQFLPSHLTDESNSGSRFFDIQSDALNNIISNNAYSLNRRVFRNANSTTKISETKPVLLNQNLTTELMGSFTGNYLSFPQTVPASGTKDLTFTMANLELSQVLYKAFVKASSADFPDGISIKKCRATSSGFTVTLKNSLATDVIIDYSMTFDIYAMY